MKPIPLKREVKKCENALDFTMLPLFKTFFFSDYLHSQAGKPVVCVWVCIFVSKYDINLYHCLFQNPLSLQKFKLILKRLKKNHHHREYSKEWAQWGMQNWLGD